MAFFDTKIAANTLKTLKARQEDPRNTWFFKKVPWIWFQSCGIPTDGPYNDDYRKEKTLFNGMNNKIWRSVDSPLSGKNRPTAGVTNLTITPKNAKGTVREATINWQCWTLEDLDALEKLYMTPGLTCSIEWGWSQKIIQGAAPDNQAPAKIDNVKPLNSKDFTAQELDFINSSEGHAGALQGRIVNFNWTINEYGGFDCTTVLLAQGDFMNQLAIDVNTTGISISLAAKGENTAEAGVTGVNNVEASIEVAKASMDDKDKLFKIGPAGKEKTYGVSIDIDAEASDNTTEDPSWKGWFGYEYIQYVNWAWIEDILITSNLSFKSTPEPDYKKEDFPDAPQTEGWCKIVPKFYSGEIVAIGEIPKREKEIIKNYKTLESQDPGVCALPYFKVKDSMLTQTSGQARVVTLSTNAMGTALDPFNPVGADDDIGELRSILVSLLWVERVYKKHKDEGTLIDFVKELLDGINDACGGIWEFDVITDEAHQCLRVVDTSQIKVEEDEFKFKAFKTNSMVRKIDIATQVSEKLKGSIMAGMARAQGAKKGKNSNTANGYSYWGAEIKDLSATKMKHSNPATDGNQVDQLESITVAPPPVDGQEQGSPEELLCNAYIDLCESRTQSSVDGAKAAFKGWLDAQTPLEDIQTKELSIPISMELEIDGITGITWGNTISCDYLPKKYKDKWSWRVTKVTHTINKGDWITKIETMPVYKGA